MLAVQNRLNTRQQTSTYCYRRTTKLILTVKPNTTNKICSPSLCPPSFKLVVSGIIAVWTNEIMNTSQLSILYVTDAIGCKSITSFNVIGNLAHLSCQCKVHIHIPLGTYSINDPIQFTQYSTGGDYVSMRISVMALLQPNWTSTYLYQLKDYVVTQNGNLPFAAFMSYHLYRWKGIFHWCSEHFTQTW
jgi:hypothetical protein